MTAQPQKPFLNLLLSQPRTCSHLLNRILNLPAQANIHEHPAEGYFFIDILGARFPKAIAGHPGITSYDADKIPEYSTLLQNCVKGMGDWVEQVEREGKGCFVKQHVPWMIDPAVEAAFVESLGPEIVGNAYDFGGSLAKKGALVGERSAGNETVLPDSLLKSFKPTILVRHPALAFSSLVRASVNVFYEPDGNNWELTFHWSKSVFDWYTANLTEAEKKTGVDGVEFPIVLDADDITNPKLVEKYARAIGLDDSLLRWSWPTATEEEVNGMPKPFVYMVDTLSKSKSVVKGKSSEGLDLDAEKKKWIAEFGEKLGGQLCALVDKAMPEYEWLKARRLQV